MPTVGPGVVEMRIRTAQEYRVMFVAKCAEAVYVLHAFEKRTRKTPHREIELARRRLQGLVALRRVRRELGG
jgi:phage-related protein